MRINKYVALATGMSRRSADDVIRSTRVTLNQRPANLGDKAGPGDLIMLDGKKLELPSEFVTIILNKPAGYICSRDGQGGKTIYELIPEKYHGLKTVGRLDKDSSGLILLTNDGELANSLAHPRYHKEKVYRIKLNKSLNQTDSKRILTGVHIDDGVSKFIKLRDCSNDTYEVVIAEGRNRQIRRTFDALGYKVVSLNRIKFGNYELKPALKPGDYSII